jgi:hypothetical protein
MCKTNSTTPTPITQAPPTGPTWTTIQPASRQLRHRPPATRWTAEDAVYHAEQYQAWLQGLDSRRWQAIYGQHTPEEMDRALGICRQFKDAKAKYDAAGQPARCTPRLVEIRRQMQATLTALQFVNPRDLWQQYQWAQYRDPFGYSPDHGAHLASVDHYLWLRDVTAALSIDNNDGGYSSPYPNNVDAALEATRTHALDYAVTDDADNPTYQLATLQRQLGHASRKSRRISAQIKTTSDPHQLRRLKTRYNAVATEIKHLAADVQELERLLTPPTDADGEETMSAQEWAKQIAFQTADYGLARTASAAPQTPTVDIFQTATTAQEAIQNLRDLQRQSQDLIAYIESVRATGKTLTPTQERMYAEAVDLLPVITASIQAQTARLQA